MWKLDIAEDNLIPWDIKEAGEDFVASELSECDADCDVMGCLYDWVSISLDEREFVNDVGLTTCIEYARDSDWSNIENDTQFCYAVLESALRGCFVWEEEEEEEEDN
jgi:hypothetical protein